MKELQHIPIPIHEKLSHLSKKEIEEMFYEYHNNNARPIDLYKKYRIEGLHYNNFKNLCTPVESTSNSCAVHHFYSWRNTLGRNKWGAPYCPMCKTELWTELKNNYFYSNIYNKKSSFNPNDVPNTVYRTLSFDLYKTFPLQLKAFIATWFVDNPDLRTFKLKLHWLQNMKICPTPEMENNFLALLLSYDLVKNNLNLTQEIILDEELSNHFKHGEFLLEATPEEYFDLWYEICYHEVREYYTYKMELHNFNTPIGEKTNEVLHYLVKNLSVQDSFNVTWRSINDGCSFLAKSNGNFRHAANTVSGSMRRRADMFLDGKLKKLDFNRTKDNAQSKISWFFSEIMTRMSEKAFTVCPSLYFIRFLRDDDLSESEGEPF